MYTSRRPKWMNQFVFEGIQMGCRNTSCALIGILLSVVVMEWLVADANAVVRRRVTIRSNPPGAVVYIDDQEIGVTPVSTTFTFYGTRKIQLIKDQFEIVTVKRTFNPPWYQLPVLDFIYENLVFQEVRDERVLDFKLVPQKNRKNSDLIQRGLQLRQRAQQGVLTPRPGETSPLRARYPTVPSRQLPAITGPR